MNNNTVSFIKKTLNNMPSDWLKLTTHRLDTYNEARAKFDFLEKFEALEDCDERVLKDLLKKLPTAYDYIRLGHPLSCILEWTVAKLKNLETKNVISFSSQSMPILAILRQNLLENKKTQIFYNNDLPRGFEPEALKKVYGYNFDLKKISEYKSNFEGVTVLISNSLNSEQDKNFDFTITLQSAGSIITANNEKGSRYISEIQHVRRRESIAMTPDDCLKTLGELTESLTADLEVVALEKVKEEALIRTISSITNTTYPASIGSSGLSTQYAIMMGLIHNSMDKHKGRAIKFIVPPNCYGGTNDQARRVAACNENIEIIDLHVDSGKDMVNSVEKILCEVASIDAVPFIIAEIPTNPRVEVPHLYKLKEVLSKKRKTKSGTDAIAPVFILDQTFCPNVKFLGDGDFLDTVATISYVSGSKFPSGGLCTAGYCVANKKAQELMVYIDNHLKLCDNQATNFQLNILSKQMPSMNERIEQAYNNTRKFVDFIEEVLPSAKINFVSQELAKDEFKPSVFSLDLPTKGSSDQEREMYKRELNLKLIDLMIENALGQSKFCVSYGQLKGCYWTIPATSTQGTTKEGDKDYIVRVAVSPDFDLDLHKSIFSRFCEDYINI